MFVRLFFIILLLILNVVPFSVLSQDSLSYKQLESILLAKNPTLKYDSLELEMALQKLSASKANRLPDLNLNVYNAISNGRALDPVTYQYYNQNFFYNTYRLQSNLNLFEGGKSNFTIDKYRLDSKIKLKTLENSKQNLSLILFLNYAELCMFKETEDLYRDRMQTLLQFKRITAEQVKEGKGTRTSLSLIDIELNKLGENLNTISSRKKAAEYKIKSMLGCSMDSAIVFNPLAKETIDSLYYTTQQLKEIAENSLQFQISGQRVHYAKNDIRLVKSYRYPTIALSGVLGSGYSSNLKTNAILDNSWRDQINNNNYQMVSLNLYVPLFNRLSNYHAIQANKILYRQSVLKDREGRLQMMEFLSRQNESLQSSYHNYSSCAESISLYEQILADSYNNLNAGRINMLEYLMLRQQKMLLDENLLAARYNYLVARKNIELIEKGYISL